VNGLLLPPRHHEILINRLLRRGLQPLNLASARRGREWQIPAASASAIAATGTQSRQSLCAFEPLLFCDRVRITRAPGLGRDGEREGGELHGDTAEPFSVHMQLGNETGSLFVGVDAVLDGGRSAVCACASWIVCGVEDWRAIASVV
jgi:hypothetical protein